MEGIVARYTKNSECGVVGSGAVVSVLPANGSRARLWLYADSGNSGKIYLRWDGTDPSSTSYHVELSAGAGLLFDAVVAAGEVKVIGSAASQRYAIEEA
tara:strand:- start:1604 stop:1900 length:297 start_codon:yes stop_codon:yes gene_type:complete